MNKKILTIVLIAFASFTATQQISGQSLLERMAKHAKKKAEQEAEKRANEKIDKQIDKTFNAIEKKYSKEEKKDEHHPAKTTEGNNQESVNHNQALNEMMKNMGMSSTPLTLDDNYDFTSSVSMNFKTYAKDGSLESNGDMVSYYNTGKDYIAYEFKDGDIKNANNEKTGFFILDFRNKATIILGNDNGENSGIAYGLGNMINKEEFNAETKDNPQFKKNNEKYEENNPYLKKTGRTKTIAGYKCEEYTYETEDVSSRFWITHDLEWNYKDLMRYTFTSSIYSYAGTNGFLMESETIDKKTGEKMLFQVTDINNNISKDINLSQYKITNLGNMNIPSGEEQQ